MTKLDKIYKGRSRFYHCKPDLFTTPGIYFIEEPKIKGKKLITLASLGQHLLLRYDPELTIPEKKIMNIQPLHLNTVSNFLAEYYKKDNLVQDSSFFYFYKLDEQIPEVDHEALEIRQLTETDYPQMNEYFQLFSEEELDFADIYLDKPDPVIFCGYINNEIVAYASHREFEEDTVDIGVLIHPDHRRKGLGTAVVKEDVQWCLNNGKIPMYRVFEFNKGSVAIPQKLEFDRLITVNAFRKAEA
ncbi:MAG: GNAT family N-acetyltransferase [Spirochaetes bacterium]|nr:GNAT family N-acetyltransferase [Spirochaetota bacterium]